MIGNRANFLFLICILVFIDQISKFIVINHLKGGLFFLRGFLGVKVYRNYGFAFGVVIVNAASIILTICMLFLLVLFFRYLFLHTAKEINVILFVLIFAGAISNLLDRLLRGYIVDFIHFSPIWIFNLADIFVLAGLVLLFFRKSKI